MANSRILGIIEGGKLLRLRTTIAHQCPRKQPGTGWRPTALRAALVAPTLIRGVHIRQCQQRSHSAGKVISSRIVKRCGQVKQPACRPRRASKATRKTARYETARYSVKQFAYPAQLSFRDQAWHLAVAEHGLHCRARDQLRMPVGNLLRQQHGQLTTRDPAESPPPPGAQALSQCDRALPPPRGVIL